MKKPSKIDDLRDEEVAKSGWFHIPHSPEEIAAVSDNARENHGNHQQMVALKKFGERFKNVLDKVQIVLEWLPHHGRTRLSYFLNLAQRFRIKNHKERRSPLLYLNITPVVIC
ncbi:hypothetical protein WA026_004193 [Henosepilachna vigintioctopunctata]|uniref:Uncharacterized protein n=1 Tax=Henosepilachna vigintioctopunctata TaxID=420089 RepID=A0AAW1U6Q4_9CUCU